jgi:hypothetical protein
MQDYKLKVIMVILSAVVFSMLFIILALVTPVEEPSKPLVKEKPKNRLEEISRSIQEK